MMACASVLRWLLILSTAMTAMVTALILRTSTTTTTRTLPFHHRGCHHAQHQNGDDSWYYRRRSRCSIAMTMAEEEQQQEQDQIIRQEKAEISDATSSNEGPPSSSTTPSCPFSKTFPRYRIDLISSRKNRNNKNKKQKEGLWQLIPDVPSFKLPSLELPSPPWKEAMQRDKVERALRKRQKRTTGSTSGNGDGLEIAIQPDIDGVKAFAFLWEESARLMGLREGYVSSSSSSSSSAVILGLPDASQTVVQNFCEIVEWMGSNLETETSNKTNNNNNYYFAGAGVGERFFLAAEFIKEENLDIPAVRLERISRPLPPGPPSDSDSDSDSGNTTNGHNNKENIIKNSAWAAAEKIINERTRLWVKRILVEQGICPFTRSDRMSGQGLVDLGVPVGSIAYHASFQKHPIGLFADTWKAIERMLEAGPAGRSGVSSILLSAPEFDADFELWAGPIFAMLEAGVVAAEAESQVGVVCFHPLYATPDGKSWPGFGHMHSVPRLEKWYRETTNELAFPGSSSESSEESCMLTTEQIAAGGAWQRRTPHATINVLRADQLEVAESRRVSGKMYTENIDKLVGVNGIGNEKLARDLEREREQGANQL